MKLYAYCVVRPDAVQPDTLRGLAACPVYTISTGDVAAVVSDFAIDTVPITRENILIHQRVVRNVLEKSTPLPFRFGTLVTKAGLTSYLEARHDALLKKLELVDSCVEMSVKVIWQQASTTGTVEPSDDENNPNEGTGTAFLRSKSRQITGDRRLVEEANEIASWLKNTVAPVVRDAHFTVRPTHRLVLAGDFLVEWELLDSYRETLQRSRNERPELHFLTSGPWPPYSFANIDLEFKTHFGVS